ncbi:9083_t:CDS:2 [Paraglomus brasilianum]|uniref:9083_t:CDS:1 n=1 Tax=Paraglomus brasilianum TaxID=144538 RepID=A0A9N9A349_9GLOM|nr:9083_t:CDS:2 [Paraglomus brasilianum]
MYRLAHDNNPDHHLPHPALPTPYTWYPQYCHKTTSSIPVVKPSTISPMLAAADTLPNVEQL